MTKSGDALGKQPHRGWDTTGSSCRASKGSPVPKRSVAFVLALALAAQVPFSQVIGTAAALAAGLPANPCHDPTPARYLPAVDPASLDPAVAQSMAEQKTAALQVNDPERANRDLSTGTAAAFAADVARKNAILATMPRRASVTILPDRATLERECARAGASTAERAVARLADAFSPQAAATSTGPGYAWVDWVNQQGQQQNTWCGPATVSEMATTMANNNLLTGPVSQSAAAASMGTDINGTDVTHEVAGINQYVAQPVVHWNYFSFVWVSTSPTQTDNTNFYNRIDYDVRNGFPLAGDANEAASQPHLVGHPLNQNIKHWFQIAGYQQYGAQVYYSDSATTIWPAVPAFSWYDLPTIVGIFGGLGYAW